MNTKKIPDFVRPALKEMFPKFKIKEGMIAIHANYYDKVGLPFIRISVIRDNEQKGIGDKIGLIIMAHVSNAPVYTLIGEFTNQTFKAMIHACHAEIASYLEKQIETGKWE